VRVKRVLNNNSVLAVNEEGHEVVAIGRGLGHGRRPEDSLEGASIDQVFIASGDASSDRLAQFLSDIPLTYIRAAGKVAELAQERLGLRISQSLILPLADHLHFAAQRIHEGINVEFPLGWEVAQLYPKELATGQAAVQIANRALGIELQPEEAVAMALHFVNSQFASPGLNKTFQMTEIITQIFDIIDKAFDIQVDQQSMNAARFVTHLRYLFIRVASGEQITEPSTMLANAIAETHPEAWGCAAKIQFGLEMGLSAVLTRDEVAYLGLHVARLVSDLRG
jgi:beta-glucoside operon transcriptional antiterminator